MLKRNAEAGGTTSFFRSPLKLSSENSQPFIASNIVVSILCVFNIFYAYAGSFLWSKTNKV